MEYGLSCNLLNLQDLPDNIIVSDMYGERSREFQKIQDVVTRTDKFIFIIPEYNGSFPGVLKVFIDSCDFPQSFAKKKCTLVGLSAGKFGNLRGLSHFSGIANYVKMDVYHNKMYLPEIDNDIADDGIINDPEHIALIESQIEGFIEF